MEESHPQTGDTIRLTGTVQQNTVMGTGLRGKVGRTASVKRVIDHHIGGRLHRSTVLLSIDGEEVKTSYKGKEKISGEAGEALSASNSQGASQAYTWEKV